MVVPVLLLLSMPGLLEQARLDMSNGRFEDAAKRFGAVLAKQPDHAEALFGFGAAASQAGRTPEAITALRRYVRLRPAAAEGQTLLGILLFAAGDSVGALPVLERAVRLDPQNFEAARALASLELGRMNAKRAVALLRPFRNEAEFAGSAGLLYASALLEAGDHRGAAEVAETLWQGSAEAAVLRVSALLRSGDADRAELACRAAMRAFPDSDEVEGRCLRTVSAGFARELERGGPRDLILLGRLLTDVVETADEPARARALAVLEKAAAQLPGDASALYNLGRCLRALARPRDALAQLHAALRANPHPELRMLVETQVAMSHDQLGENEPAAEAFERALALNRALPSPKPAPAFRYAEFLRATGRAEKADELVAEILRWSPAYLPARLESARRQHRAGDSLAAAKEAELVVGRADPADRDLLRAAHVLLLQAYNALGRDSDAQRVERWLDQHPH